MTTETWGIDYGGTRLRIGRVDPVSGAVDRLTTLDSSAFTDNAALSAAVVTLLPPGCAVGISAAGVVDEQSLMILVSPNSPIRGRITLAADVAAAGHRCVLLNDIRAAAQGEASYGGHPAGSIAVATYSTGYNCAVAVDGRVSCRQPEAGHCFWQPLQLSARCNCNGASHLETYVSGGGAARMARDWLVGQAAWEHPILALAMADRLPELDPAALCDDASLRDQALAAIGAEHVYRAFRANPTASPQREIREEQVAAIAGSLSILFGFCGPLQHIACMGSQTRDWDILFEPAIARFHAEGFLPALQAPSVARTALPEIGVQGAVAYLAAGDRGCEKR